MSGTGMKVCIGTGGTGIHIVPKLPKYPVPVLVSYRSYLSVRYRFDVVPNLPICGVPVILAVYTGGMPLCVPY